MLDWQVGAVSRPEASAPARVSLSVGLLESLGAEQLVASRANDPRTKAEVTTPI